MRLALLSDIHGNLAALEAVVADIRRRGADQIVNLGDSVSGPLLPRRGCTGYEPMARLATERGRPEGAVALRTGNVS